MGLEELVQSVISFVREHQNWAAPVIFLLAFGESLAFVSIFVPGWAALVGIGALVGTTDISFWSIWIAGAVGASLGDWLSYSIGYYFKDRVGTFWPLSKYPEMLRRAEDFVRKWGVPGIFIGRFFGPLRAFVPLAAGIFEMPYWRFQFANWTSAFLWAAVVLAPGSLGVKYLM